jgi:hypothetical protein
MKRVISLGSLATLAALLLVVFTTVALMSVIILLMTGTLTVLLRFTMLDMEMGVQDLGLDPVVNKPGHYATNGYALSMNGNWEIDLIVRRAGSNDVTCSP